MFDILSFEIKKISSLLYFKIFLICKAVYKKKKKIETSRSNIANYENDKNMPSVDILEKLAILFNVSIDYLLGKSEIRNPDEIQKVQFANAGGLDTKGLDEEDLEELQRQIDYIKKMKGKK